VRRTWGARARALGWMPGPDDDEDTRTLRGLLVPLVAGAGEDPALEGEARRIAAAFGWVGRGNCAVDGSRKGEREAKSAGGEV
jgi:alanyl aminopeptidase